MGRVLLKGGTLVSEASANESYKQVKWTKSKAGGELDFIIQIHFYFVGVVNRFCPQHKNVIISILDDNTADSEFR